MGDLGIRVTSGVIGLVFLVAVLFLGGSYLGLALTVLSIVALGEFYSAIEKMSIRPVKVVGYVSVVGILMEYRFGTLTLDFIFTAFVMASLASTVLLKNRDIRDSALTVVGVLYIPFLLFHILYLEGTPYIWMIFLIAFGTDTFAYLVGTKFGKNKLCPEISPKKSVEGAIGGIAGSILITVAFAAIMDVGPLFSIAILSLVGSVLSQLGDLTASRIKRIAGIKDYGSIMPGHGGMLDRFDSIIFTAPVVYYYATYFLI